MATRFPGAISAARYSGMARRPRSATKRTYLRGSEIFQWKLPLMKAAIPLPTDQIATSNPVSAL